MILKIQMAAIILILSAIFSGCGPKSNRVFIPEVQSTGQTAEPIYLPVVPSERNSATTEDLVDSRSRNLNAGNADVVFVKALLDEDNTWTFSVTVAHPDTGWDDYADGWDVLLPDGTVLKPDPESLFTRLLLHPHENEQPFTRSQDGIAIPVGTDYVVVRAHDMLDGFGGKEVRVDLKQSQGRDFEVQR